MAEPPPPAEGGRKASIFGEARPRDVVLRERGADGSGASPSQASSLGRYVSSTSGPTSKATSAHSGGLSGDDEWHTVGGERRRGRRGGDERPDDGDLLLGRGRPPLPRGYGEGYYQGGGGGGRRGSGVYGSPSAGGYSDDELGADDSGLFRRALPTRSGDLF